MSNYKKISQVFAAAVLSLSIASIANAQSSDEKPQHKHFVKHICALSNDIKMTKGVALSAENQAKIDACIPKATAALESCRTPGLAPGQFPNETERAQTRSCMESKGFKMPTPPERKS